jgi:hypothetical protein
MSTPARNQYPVLAPEELRAQVTDALLRYEKGEQVRQICASYDVSNVTLYKRIIDVAEDEWKAIQVARALSIKERAEEEIQSAPDALSLARARDALKAAQWDLERVCRRIYGQEPAAVLGSGVINITIGINRGDAAALPPIEGESKQVDQK